MQRQQTLKRHANLVDRMASQVGVDLEETMLRGKLTISELEDAVLSCTLCSQADACESLLRCDACALDSPPDYCRNDAMLGALKDD